MAATVSDILASLRAMLPEHRVIILKHYGEPEIRELLSEVVRNHSVENQRTLLLSQLSCGVVSEVEVAGPPEEERVDDDMLDIDDEGEGLEQASKYRRRTPERRLAENLN
jgi:hypothetical protein